MFDFIVIGAGISGASVAYFLKQSGKKVLVIDKSKIASGGSGAAGAFLSPKICSDSSYTLFVNRAFEFSLRFYKENFASFLRDDGILRILKSKEEFQNCKKSENILPKFEFLTSKDVGFLKKDTVSNGGYLFEGGALIDSIGVIKEMLKDMEVKEDLHVKSLKKIEEGYEIEGIKTKGVVFCTGSEIIGDFPYIKLKKIYGHRADIKTDTKVPFHIHKECSISSSRDGIVHIGATHIPNYRFKGESQHEQELNQMLKKAKSYIDFKNFEIKKVHFGCRSSSFDFFPIVGKLIDYKATLEKFPYIKKGTKVPKEKYIYHKNLYIHTGVGARGFVLSPFGAKLLTAHILNSTQMEKEIDTDRVFVKYSKKST